VRFFYKNKQEYIDITEHLDFYIVHIPCLDTEGHSVKKKHFIKDKNNLFSMEKVIKCNKCKLAISIVKNQIRDT
jgi:hypothetical protein